MKFTWSDVNIAIFSIMVFTCSRISWLIFPVFIFPEVFLPQSFSVGSPLAAVEAKNAVISPYKSGSSKYFLLSDAGVSSDPRVYLFSVVGTMLKGEDLYLPDEVKDKGQFYDVIATAEKIFYLKTNYSRTDKKKSLYAHPVTWQIQVDPAAVEVASIPAEKENRSGDFGVNVSANGKFIVVFSQYPSEKDAKEKFSITVLDELMVKKWSREFEFPLSDNRDFFNDVYISDKGNVFIMKRVDAVNFSGYVVNEATNELKECRLDLPDGKKIMNFKIIFNDKEEAVISGFYTASADIRKDPSFDGTYFFAVSTDGKVLSQNINSFDAKLYDLKIRYLLPLKDGKFLLAAEESKREGAVVNIQYVNGSAHLFMLDSAGKEKWKATIDKKATSYDDAGMYSSFGLYEVEDKFFVFFNDQQAKYSSVKGKVPFMISISTDGSQEKPVSLLSDKIGGNGEIMLLSSAGISDDGTIYFIGTSKESFFPLKIELDDE